MPHCRSEAFTEKGVLEGRSSSAVVNSDIVCFESGLSTENEHHAAIMISERSGAFPPNTLFKLKVREAWPLSLPRSRLVPPRSRVPICGHETLLASVGRASRRAARA